MKLVNLFLPTNCLHIVGLLLALFSTQSLCLPSPFSDSLSSSNDDSFNRTSSHKYPIIKRSPRSPSSPSSSSSSLASNSNQTNSQDRLPVSFGLFVTTANSSAISYCMAHFNYWTISSKPDNFYSLVRVDNINFCSASASKPPFVRDDPGSYILINYNTKCPLAEQAFNVASFFPRSKG